MTSRLVKISLFLRESQNENLKIISSYYLTDAQLCRKQNEIEYLADKSGTYQCYLESSPYYKELCEIHEGRVEMNVVLICITQTADMVGLKLSHDPK